MKGMLVSRWLNLIAGTAFALILATTTVVAQSSVRLSNKTCFGTGADSFGYFVVDSQSSQSGFVALDFVTLTFAADGLSSTGVRCSPNDVVAPFQCHEYAQVGIACQSNFTSTQSLSSRNGVLTLIGENTTAVNGAGTLIVKIGRRLPVKTRCAVVYLSDFYNQRDIESTSSGSSCVTVDADYLVQSDLTYTLQSVGGSAPSPLPACSTTTDKATCNLRTACGWAPSSQTCCPKRSLLDGSTTEDPRCRCSILDDILRTSATRSANARCKVALSSFFNRNLIQQYCVQAAPNDLENCRNEFDRCQSWNLDDPAGSLVGLIDIALNDRCAATGYASCADPNLVCIAPPAAPPTPRPIYNTSAPVLLDSLPVSTTTKTIAVSDIVAGASRVVFSLLPGTNAWNQTTVNSIRDLRRAFSAPPVKFGFNSAMILSNHSVQLLTPYDLEITFGPYPFRPEAYELPITFLPTTNMFLYPVAASAINSVTMVATRERPDTLLVNFTNTLSIVAALGTFVSGASGWLGLATIQTNMLMAGIQCAELETQSYFPNSVYIVTPWRYVDSSHRFVFSIGLATAAAAILIHLILLGLHKLVSRPRVWMDSMRATWFPYLYFYFSAFSLVGITQTAFTGLFDDPEAYVRVLFVIADLIFTGVLFVFWRKSLQNSYEGYYVLYGSGKDKNLEGESTALEDAQRRANYGSIFAARWEELKQSWRDHGWRGFFQRSCRYWLLPRGYWPSAKGFTAIREQCHSTGCSFTLLSLGFFFLAGVNASHESNDRTFCYAVYWDYVLLSVGYFVLFLFFQPFRIPFLNLLWSLSHILEIAMYSSAADWIQKDDPTKNDGTRIKKLAVAVLCVQGLFNLTVLIVTLVERVLLLKQVLSTQDDALEPTKSEPPVVLPYTAAALNADSRSLTKTPPVPMYDQGRRQARSSSPDFYSPQLRQRGSSPDQLQQPAFPLHSNSRSRSLRSNSTSPPMQVNPLHQQEQEFLRMRAERLRDMDRRGVKPLVELKPIPANYLASHILNVFYLYGAESCDVSGESAFLRFSTLKGAEDSCEAFHQRLFQGAVCDCQIVGPQELVGVLQMRSRRDLL